mmetsp:Transcript_3808/g.8865  ORF Transcript_3808/g.8865 Transcript_3808/m.8865 type:complete len:262 (-) Transcript_3808:2058-2843(-)
MLHSLVELVANSERVLDNNLLEMLNGTTAVLAAGELCLPGSCTFKLISSQDVVHEVAIDVLENGVLVNISSKKQRMDGVDSAVATNVEVVTIFGCNHAKVLALSLGTLTDTPRNGRLHFVGRAHALVSVLYANCKAHGVLDAIATPGGTNAGLDGAKSLAIRVATLQSGLAQLFPDVRELILGGTEQIDTLGSGDLGVEIVLLGDLAHCDELVGGQLASRNTRDDRVRPSSLHVGERPVVGVLEGIASATNDSCVVVDERG